MNKKLGKADFVSLVEDYLDDNNLIASFIDYAIYKRGLGMEQLPFDDDYLQQNVRIDDNYNC